MRNTGIALPTGLALNAAGAAVIAGGATLPAAGAEVAPDIAANFEARCSGNGTSGNSGSTPKPSPNAQTAPRSRPNSGFRGSQGHASVNGNDGAGGPVVFESEAGDPDRGFFRGAGASEGECGCSGAEKFCFLCFGHASTTKE